MFKSCEHCNINFNPIEDYYKLCDSCLKTTTKEERALTLAAGSRKLAKFYGGKALKGSAAQKKWAEKIRETILRSDELSDEEKIKLLQTGGFTQHSKFWIENREVAIEEFTAKNIVAQYKGLCKLESEQVRTRLVHEIRQQKKIISDYIDQCSFNFKSDFV